MWNFIIIEAKFNRFLFSISHIVVLIKISPYNVKLFDAWLSKIGHLNGSKSISEAKY